MTMEWGGYIHKDSQWKNKIDSEKFWFENLPRELLIYTPRFFKDANGYKVEYLYNNTLAELFVFGNLPSYTWKRIFESLKEFLKLLHSFKGDDILLDFDYRAKTLQRLGVFAEQSGVSLEENWKINNIEYPSLLELVRLLDDHLQGNIDFSIIHGDFCFSNIMYDFRANAIKTFDPRGMDFSEKTSLYGDCRYDFAKLLHSVFGLYDFIVAGFFRCNFKNNEIVFQIEKDEKIKKSARCIYRGFWRGYAKLCHNDTSFFIYVASA
ncbi:aminoglycoside phosphotransferase family protein [Helicobacter sp. 14348-15]|uniref:aminoglycoside phosphotransferase family protein n=1 Tax=Helicobacter colisuis TaxID=2949739 RepID=UPI00202AE667|nr:aminoglycoside phosphotransferase family protein [Helicobacter colisuis]MCL9821040.1 aminoglycoside phosphotransferase family protein [Helicobacter colisuis]